MKKQSVAGLSLSIFSALLLAVTFSLDRLWILAWVSFVPLFFALRNKSAKKAFFLAYLSGFVFWGCAIYWLINVTLFGQIILVFYLALYFGIFGLLLTSFPGNRPCAFIFFAPCLWVVLEYLRSHLLTGFPWALLGYSQYTNLPVIQGADIAGVWLVSFLVMMVNAAIYAGIRYRVPGIRLRHLLLPILCLAFTLIYGYYKLHHPPSTNHQPPFKVSVIQGNIQQGLKWDPGSREFIMERYFKLTSEALGDRPDLIVWPEAALPVVLEEEPVYYERLLRYSGSVATPLLFGAVTLRDGLYYNSALLLSKEGKLLDMYDKLHLVPFGEYIPLRKVFTFLETIAPIGDIARGKEYTLFDSKHRFAVLICFEDVFPELSRRFVRKGADFLINITNDAWFGKTTEASQHLAASVFRAVENRVNVVRAANTGISGFISPQGRITSLITDGMGNNIFVPGYLTGDIYINKQPAPYSYLGDYFVILCLAGTLCILFFSRRQKIKKTS